MNIEKENELFKKMRSRHNTLLEFDEIETLNEHYQEVYGKQVDMMEKTTYWIRIVNVLFAGVVLLGPEFITPYVAVFFLLLNLASWVTKTLNRIKSKIKYND